MIMKCMEKLLDDSKSRLFFEQVNTEINALEKKLNVINIETILKIMGFPNE